MRAIVADAPGVATPHEVPFPTLKGSDMLVKVKAVALNPTDWRTLYDPARVAIGQRVGCDFAGYVDVAPANSGFKTGDRVAGFVFGGANENGSFADFTKVDPRFVWRVPQNQDFTAAAAMGGVASSTAVQSVFFRHRLNKPDNPTKSGEPILVWSGASSVGMYAIQLLKLSGYTVVTTASPELYPLVKSLGADDVYDYQDPMTPSKIASKYPTLSRAVDTFGSATLVSQSLGANGRNKTVWSTMPLKEGDVIPADVKYSPHTIWTTLGHSNKLWGIDFPSTPEEQAEYADWMAYVPQLIESGKFKPNPLLVQEGGLDQVQAGLALLHSGKAAGKKVVIKL